ncbi:MAG: SGNH/GDSL hydrolase family protein [Alphaproteobacteria bacterium]
MHLLPAKIILGPALLMQGKRVRKNIIKLPEASGARQKLVEGASLRLLLIGDSSAAGGGVETQQDALIGQIERHMPDASLNWHVEARSGMTTPQMITHLQSLPEQKHDAVISALGVNDITAGTDIEDWLDQQRALIQDVQDRFKPDIFVMSGLPPVGRFPALPNPLRWYLGQQAQHYDRALRRLLAQQDFCHFLPLDFNDDPDRMAADGFHPGPGIYRDWGQRIAHVIQHKLVAEAA